MGSDITAEEIAKAAKAAFEESQLLPAAVRINALAKIKQQLEANKAEILAANKQDMEVQHHFSAQDP
jgi:glutamate-5-semialdehyde dehydrogenase